MDTNVSDADLTHAGLGLTAPISLPGEGAGHGEPPVPPFTPSPSVAPDARPQSSKPKRKRSRKGLLLAGVAVVLLAGAGGAAYVFRQPLQVLALRHGVTLPSWVPAALFQAPSPAPVRMAHQAEPSEHGSTPRLPAPLPLPVASLVPRAPVAAPKVEEIGAFKTGTDKPQIDAASSSVRVPTATAAEGHSAETNSGSLAVLAAATPVAAVSTPAPPPPAPAKPDVQPDLATATSAKPAEVSAPATPVAAPALDAPSIPTSPVVIASATSTPVPSAVVIPRPAQNDAVAMALALQAAPFSRPQQVEVLGLVKNLAGQLRDTRVEVHQLQETVAQLSAIIETKLTDFDGRLGLAEASAMVQSSAKAGAPAPMPSPASAPAAPPPHQGGRLAAASSATAGDLAPERRSVKDYILRGASPGLAVVAAANPVPGSPAVFELAAGDSLPGLGRVKRVYQRGTAWVVETDGGSIQ